MEPQTLTITIEYKVEHSPATEEQLEQIAKNYFKGKGILLEDKKIRI